MNLLNLKISLFFLSYLPQFIHETSINFTLNILILGFFFILIAFFIFSIITLFSDLIRKILSKNERYQIIINRLTFIILIILSINLLFA
jgi:threonine/homoserine/homoserine lactone efflux protein